MKKILTFLAMIFTVSVPAEVNFLSVCDATGGAPTGYFMRAAIHLSTTARLNFSMCRKLPSEALPMLERGEIDAVLIDRRFIKDQPHIPVAADALVLYVSTANPAVNLTKNQVLEILTARRPGWQNYIQLNFDIQRIAPELESQSGTIIRRVFGEAEIDPEIFKVDTPSGGFAFVNTASIFFTQFQSQPPVEVKALSINGITPTSATVRDGTYPLAIQYVLVYKDLTPKLQALIYLLKQNQYRAMIHDEGLQVLLEE